MFLKSGILVIAMCWSVASKAESPSTTYKMATKGGVLELTTKSNGEFVMNSGCRKMSGMLVDGRPVVIETIDKCAGTPGNLQNLKVFMRVRNAKSVVRSEDLVRFLSSDGTELASFANMTAVSDVADLD